VKEKGTKKEGIEGEVIRKEDNRDKVTKKESRKKIGINKRFPVIQR
jgi:hypothetical protein